MVPIPTDVTVIFGFPVRLNDVVAVVAVPAFPVRGPTKPKVEVIIPVLLMSVLVILVDCMFPEALILDLVIETPSPNMGSQPTKNS